MDEQRIWALLASGQNIDQKDELERTPLLLAAEEERTDLLMALIKAGADVDATVTGYEAGLTALGIAARKGQVEAVKALCNAGASLEARVKEGGYTPLMLAVWYNHQNAAAALIEAGANINAYNDRGRTVLGFCKGEQQAMAEFLIKSGAENRRCVALKSKGRYYIKEGSEKNWTGSFAVCFDKKTERYTAYRSFCGAGGSDLWLYEITKEIYEGVDAYENCPEELIKQGRMLFEYENERWSPENATVYDERYRELCDWTSIPKEPYFTTRKKG